jgi:hypothetical protein
MRVLTTNHSAVVLPGLPVNKTTTIYKILHAAESTPSLAIALSKIFLQTEHTTYTKAASANWTMHHTSLTSKSTHEFITTPYCKSCPRDIPAEPSAQQLL